MVEVRATSEVLERAIERQRASRMYMRAPLKVPYSLLVALPIRAELDVSILTGTQLDGTAFPPGEDRTCGNWTKSGEGSAMVGHHDRFRRTATDRRSRNEFREDLCPAARGAGWHHHYCALGALPIGAVESQAQEPPPIVQPGAPGAPSRAVSAEE